MAKLQRVVSAPNLYKSSKQQFSTSVTQTPTELKALVEQLASIQSWVLPCKTRLKLTRLTTNTARESFPLSVWIGVVEGIRPRKSGKVHV